MGSSALSLSLTCTIYHNLITVGVISRWRWTEPQCLISLWLLIWYFYCRSFIPVSGPFVDQWGGFSGGHPPPQVLIFHVRGKKFHSHSCLLQFDFNTNIFFCRGLSECWKGSSILMKEQGQWVELAGHDYVMDLIADLELPTDFPKQKSYFVISTDDPARARANASLSVHKTHTQIHNSMQIYIFLKCTFSLLW